MKAIGLPPSDPRMRQMNDAQWLWCYFNQVEDEKIEADTWKSRFDYLTYFINFDMAKSVHDSAESDRTRSSKYQKEGLHKNTAFEMEMRAASLGYDPADGLSIEEFLNNHQNKNKDQDEPIDITTASVEELLASGEFTELADHGQGVGNPNEYVDDFLERAFEFGDSIADKDSFDIDESDWDQLNNVNNKENEEERIQEELDLDFDFFDVDD